MNAGPLLELVVAGLAEARLEAVLIGNAAAAIQGAPVTTVDFDFMFRATATNLKKLKKFARQLDAVRYWRFWREAYMKKAKRDRKREAALAALRKESKR